MGLKANFFHWPVWKKFVQAGVFIALVLLGALVFACVVSPSPNMKDLGWMPRNLANWADLNPTFRNFPAFAALSLTASFAAGFQRNFKAVLSAFLAALAVSVFGTVM